MKLKTNLFLGKKPTLEEGLMIHTVSDEDIIIESNERSRCCRICLYLLKVLFYVLLLALLLYLMWLGFIVVTRMLDRRPNTLMCGVNDIDDRRFKSTEVDDMIKFANENSSQVDYANIDPMDDYLPNQGPEMANENKKALQDYMKRVLQLQLDEAESRFPTSSDRTEQ